MIGSLTGALAGDTSLARSNYEEPQKAYTDFVRSNDIPRLEREIAEREKIVEQLRAAAAVRTSFADQELKRQQDRLAGLYAEAARLEALITQARSLRDQVATTGENVAPATADALALLLLQASAYTSGASVPLQLQVEAGDLVGSRLDPADVDALIDLLEDRRTALEEDVRRLSAEIVRQGGAPYLFKAPSSDDPLMQALGERYPQLLGASSASANPGPASDPIEAAIRSLVAEVQALHAEFETQRSQLQQLQQARDAAWTSYVAKASEASEASGFVLGAASEQSSLLLSLASTFPGLLPEEVPTQPAEVRMLSLSALQRLQADPQSLQGQLEAETARRNELVQARDLAWETYSSLIRKAEELKVEAGAGGSVVRLAGEVQVPTAPQSRRVLLNTALAAVVGLMLAVGTAFLLEYMDDTVRSRSELPELLQLMPLGAIPRGQAPPGSEPAWFAEGTDPVAEGLRRLRTNLQIATWPDSRSVVFVSPEVGEGKTTLVANMARLFAQAGRRTVLVDGDLRKPQLHRMLELPNRAGLSNVLSGNSST